MPSYTSNSNERLVPSAWLRSSVVGILMALVVLGALEILWRSRGLQPSINDDANLWCLARGTVRPNDPSQFVIIGDSRAHYDIDPAIYTTYDGGHKPVQLAVIGSSCIPVLRDLSDDPTFRGIILCEVNPAIFFGGIDLTAQPQEGFIRQFHGQSFVAPLEQRLKVVVQSHLSILLPDVALTPANIRSWIDARSLPQPELQITVLADRSCRLDFSKANIPSLRASLESAEVHARPGADADRLTTDLFAIESMVEKIQNRGGQVVFISLPVTDTIREITEKYYPPSQYWSALAERTHAVTVNYADYPELSKFDCPDESHIAGRDVPEFTRSLATIIQGKLLKQATATPRATFKGS